ncbi:MAG: type 1 glutamine amidotransferase [Ectothiorhodospiraceae bacterium]|nr:type 1 glutamine amidotransferase [Ectothiorhodospiraceae bacterium]
MELKGKHVAILVADLFEDLEFYYPYYRLKEAGAEVTVLGTGASDYAGKKGLSASQDAAVKDRGPEEFDAVVIPGGYAPDHMRRHRPMIDFVRGMHEAGKPVAFICHAGWVPASADIVRGGRVTSFKSIRDDMVNAGAEWVDQEVVRDGNLISSRVPPDLPAFCRTLIQALVEQ